MKPSSDKKDSKVRTSFSTKEVLTFLFFCSISFILWVLTVLSNTQESEVEFSLKYSPTPSQYALSESFPTHITANVKDIGFHLLFYKIKNDSILIDINNRFTSKDSSILISEKELRNCLHKEMNEVATIIQIYPREIAVNYSSLTKKTLPIILTGNITPAQQYLLSGANKLNPNQIEVYGPASILDTTKSIRTKPLNLNGLSKITHAKIDLILGDNIVSSIKTVDVTIPVEQFTEKMVSVPIVGLNFPKNIQLRTFPATVNVSFLVGLSHFEQVNEDDITAYLDYNQILKNNNGKETVLIESTDKLISNLKATPAVVEYIFEKSGK